MRIGHERDNAASALDRASGPVSQQGSSCRNRVPRILDDLGRDRGFLYRDRDFWPHVATEILCRDRVWGLGQGALVVTRVPLCRDRVFPRLGHVVCDRRFYVATRLQGWCCNREFLVATHKQGLHAQQSTGCTHGKPRHAHERGHQQRCCEHDRANLAHDRLVQ